MTTDKVLLLKCVWENDTDKPANWSAFCLTLSSKQVLPSFFFPHTVISLLSSPLYSAISPLFSLSCLPWPIRLDATSESCVECIYECCEPLNEKYWQLLFFLLTWVWKDESFTAEICTICQCLQYEADRAWSF